MLLPVWGWTARPCSAGSPPTGGWHRGVAGEAGAGPATAVVRGAAADAVHADRRCGPAAVRIPVRAVTAGTAAGILRACLMWMGGDLPGVVRSGGTAGP